jgi:hypothetical protein
MTTDHNNKKSAKIVQDSLFGPSIPPESIRLKGKLIKSVEASDISSQGVKIQFSIVEVLGYGSTFSSTFLANDTTIALLKFGHFSLNKLEVDSLKEQKVFIAEMKGSPIIKNNFTIYKLLLTQ